MGSGRQVMAGLLQVCGSLRPAGHFYKGHTVESLRLPESRQMPGNRRRFDNAAYFASTTFVDSGGPANWNVACILSMEMNPGGASRSLAGRISQTVLKRDMW